MLALTRTLVLCLLAWLSLAAQATTLAFLPAAQQVDLGSIASVDVQVTGLNNQRVGAYDFFVDFDPALLSMLSVDFGPSLGYPFDNLSNVATSSGRVTVAEVSLLPDLSGLQSSFGDLLLFTLRFQTLATGTSSLDFVADILGVSGGYLGDDAGAPLAITAPDAGSITIVTAPPPPPPPVLGVPEPSSVVLAAIAMAAAGARRRRPTHGG